MKICIVIQSDAFRDSAGMRIRYDRFRESLDPHVATIDAATTAELAASRTLDHDAYIFCKTFDTPALLLARRMRAAGKTVGQDLFDDYFSQTSDPRLQRYREWLRDMAPVTDFAICSTPRMAEVVRPYLPNVRIGVVEDPIIGFDAARIAVSAEAKVEQARSSGVLDVVWFGIGDNPFFPVGLTDLAACEQEFALMTRLGWTVQLNIVTNRRAFEGVGAESLRRLSVPFEVIEWTEETEHKALAAAVVAIIPVNGQAFSRAKSLNRAVTALEAGCQVLSIGYPLYDRLDPFIYRSTERLITDIRGGTPRVSSRTAKRLSDRITSLADPVKAANAFVNETRAGMQAGQRALSGSVCLIHGQGSTISIHKAVGAIGGLSVKTIFCKASWNFPVRFDCHGSEIVMRVTPQVASKFALPLRDGRDVSRIGDLDFVDIDHAAMGLRTLHVEAPEQTNSILDLPLYADVVSLAEEGCRLAFPESDVLISDVSARLNRPARADLPKRPRARTKPADRPAAEKQKALRGEEAFGGVRWPMLRGIGRLRGRLGNQSARAADLLTGSSLFDAAWYLSRYPDVAASGLDPVRHYLEFGWREGRNPSPSFSTKGYLKANKDVAQHGLNPLVHYIEHGQVEGRKAPAAEKGGAHK